ncbi:MAG TPA: hypothetical protein VFU02_17320 [Polyangiaceae bacterium]|nr:hypothetical protein [Polyangiaceae bacterium]
MGRPLIYPSHPMLFSYLTPAELKHTDDVMVLEAPLECFDLDRPLILADELHIAGAVAFATAFGFSGVSLLEWALVQTLGSPDDDTCWDEVPPDSMFPSKG